MKIEAIKANEGVVLSSVETEKGTFNIWYTDDKKGKVRSIVSKFPSLYRKLIDKGMSPRVFEFDDKATIESSLAVVFSEMKADKSAELKTPEKLESEPDTWLPPRSSSENGSQTREFVVDVKGLDIKKEIHHATVDFVKVHAEANLDKVLDKLVQNAVKKLTPNYIQIGERKKVEIKGRTHKAFQECLFLCEHHRQVFISGPAGTGKTTLGEQVAKALDLPFAFISCSAGMSEAHLLGRMLFDGSYIASDFVTLYENGGVFLMDEVDAADANTLLIINSALANGIISIPNRKEKSHAKRHKDFILVASANTWGAGSFEYHGRNHLDAAFMDRFAMSRLPVNYDKAIEKEFCSDFPELAKTLWQIRKNCENNKIRKIVSTRAFKEGAIQMSAGKNLNDVMSRFFVGWTKEEIAKVYEKQVKEEIEND